MRWKLHFIILTILFLFSDCLQVSADSSGSLNENISWSISGNVMTISGNGEMGDVMTQPYSSYKDNVTSIIVEDGVTSIGNTAFSDFKNLTSVKLPQTLQHIDSNAFSYCYNLSSINIPSSVEYIGNAAFYGTLFLSKITDDFVILGNGVLYTYKGSSSEIIIPDGVKSITDRIFASKSDITSVSLPGSVIRIGENAFFDCTNLDYMVIPYGVSYIGRLAVGYELINVPTVNPDFKIYSFPDTYGYYYASENSITNGFVGDLSENENLDSYDALMILENICGTRVFNSRQIAVSDMDSDRKVTSYDALSVLNYSVGEWK